MQCAILVAVAIDWWQKRQERSTSTTSNNPDLEAARPEPDGAMHENG